MDGVVVKIALITTTISVPTVLSLYWQYGSAVVMYVAGDRKTPSETAEFCRSINARYLSYEQQHAQWPALSEAIGPDCIQRRNFALLAALQNGADIIVSIDDDNLPVIDYFSWIRRALIRPFSGYRANGFASWMPNWFDPGQLLVPPARHRGFPLGAKSAFRIDSVVDARIGVAAGMCLGDPDVDAVTRIAGQCDVHNVSELARAGIVTDPRQTTTVFNSQNTSFIRELAPAMFMPPGLGRHDDIFASLVCQRVMRDGALHVHFGQPFVWQQRNPHDLVQDLKAEIVGMEHILEFARRLDTTSWVEPSMSVAEQVGQIYAAAETMDWFPEQTAKAAQAWCEAVERVL